VVSELPERPGRYRPAMRRHLDVLGECQCGWTGTFWQGASSTRRSVRRAVSLKGKFARCTMKIIAVQRHEEVRVVWSL
jgi:hypothetical protein